MRMHLEKFNTPLFNTSRICIRKKARTSKNPPKKNIVKEGAHTGQKEQVKQGNNERER